MVCVSTASIPPITRYECYSCGYVSKPEPEYLYSFTTLPERLWNDEEEKKEDVNATSNTGNRRNAT
jgi:hypothetical protein